MTKLTDEERAASVRRAHDSLAEMDRQHRKGFDSYERFGREVRDARLIIEQDIELRDRRSADLTAEEVEALRWLRHDAAKELNPVEDDGCDCFSCNRHRLALSVLDRLIARGGK